MSITAMSGWCPNNPVNTVLLRQGDTVLTCTPDEARSLALSLFRAAASAEHIKSWSAA